MSYFNPAFIAFFKDLSKNNSTEWFNTNRKVYEKEVKKPFAGFVDEMIGRIRQYEPGIQIKASDAIARINKDIRFSKDKTPYHTHVAANISLYGKKDKSYPGFYFQLSPEAIHIYGGAYMLENDRLALVRQLISSKVLTFSKVINSPAFLEKFGGIQGEKNKRIPEEFQAALAREPLIANKQFYYSAELKPDLLLSGKLPEQLMEYYLAAKPVNDFLKQAWD